MRLQYSADNPATANDDLAHAKNGNVEAIDL
jgi:hypothetical protein